jgi:predicted amidohydrolase
MPIGDSSRQISVVVHQHAQLVVFPELEPLAEVFAAEPELAVRL